MEKLISKTINYIPSLKNSIENILEKSNEYEEEINKKINELKKYKKDNIDKIVMFQIENIINYIGGQYGQRN